MQKKQNKLCQTQAAIPYMCWLISKTFSQSFISEAKHTMKPTLDKLSDG